MQMWRHNLLHTILDQTPNIILIDDLFFPNFTGGTTTIHLNGSFSKAVMLSATKAIVNTENFGPKKKEKKEEKEEMPSIQKVNR